MSLDVLQEPTANTESENGSPTHPSPFTLNMRQEIGAYNCERRSLIQAQETFNAHRATLTEHLAVAGLDDSALRSLGIRG
jgi:hypothetical protein